VLLVGWFAAEGGCPGTPNQPKRTITQYWPTPQPNDNNHPTPPPKVLALFNKAVRKLHAHLRAAKEAAISRKLPRPSSAPTLAPAAGVAGMDDELAEAAEEVQKKLRAQFDPAELAQYAVTGACVCVWGGCTVGVTSCGLCVLSLSVDLK